MTTNNYQRQLLQQMFAAAIEAAQPAQCVPSHLPEVPRGRLIVIGAGKASAAMARAVEDHWPGQLSGLVVTRYGYAVPCQRIEIVEAAHPVPDAAGLAAAGRIFDLVSNLSADDTVLCLISGGGSALLALPLAGITLEEKQAVNRELLKSGASISEMNCIRRHLSAIKGGRLAAACHPARIVTLLISDVPGTTPAISPPVPRSAMQRPARMRWPSCGATASNCQRKSWRHWKADAANPSSPTMPAWQISTPG
jgi:glycerate 2-kinase